MESCCATAPAADWPCDALALVHHSIKARETNSNFGFNLPWWDRLFGSYRDQSEAGHKGMTIGTEQFRDAREQRLDQMLTQPFREDDRSYPLERREPNA